MLHRFIKMEGAMNTNPTKNNIQFYTYLHCRPDGTPFYVGKGSGYRKYRKTRKYNQYHTNILTKYGKENIRVFVFPCDSEEQAFSDEIQQIAQLRLAGYKLANLTSGGEGASGAALALEARAKIGKSLKGNKHALGAIRSEETRKKMSTAKRGCKMPPESVVRGVAARAGYKHSEEIRAKLSKALKGRVGNMLGKKFTLEHREKLSLAKKNKPWTEARRMACKGSNHE